MKTAHLRTPMKQEPASGLSAVALPTLGQPFEGGTFEGLTTRKDGTNCAVVLLPERKEGVNWQDAKAWAAEQGGELPTCPVAALLFANAKDRIKPCWHWTSEEDAGLLCRAWHCHFGYGYQLSEINSNEGGAVAVRLIPITA